MVLRYRAARFRRNLNSIARQLRRTPDLRVEIITRDHQVKRVVLSPAQFAQMTQLIEQAKRTDAAVINDAQ